MNDDRIAAEKRAVRRQARAVRAALSPEARVGAALALPKWVDRIATGRVGAAAAYLPIGDELDPIPLFEALLVLGWQGALPVVVEPGAPLEFRRWSPGDALEAGVFGTRHPAAATPVIAPDLVLVPLLAFDEARRRLGYGGGFYDRTLAELRAAKPALLAVGVAFAAQRVARVPTEPWDAPLDLVLTEEGVV